jgi:4-hydroxy-tetrahydrodipicolinate reductase
MGSILSLAVHGAAGRMGQRVVALAAADDSVRLHAAIERIDHPQLGNDVGLIAGAGSLGVPLTAAWPDGIGVMIDFSLPEAAIESVRHCRSKRIPLVMATTGLSAAHRQELQHASDDIPLVFSPSMSPAVNLVFRLAQQATRALRDVPGGVDIEIIERHHRHKADAPSGTALKFGELIAEQLDGDIHHRHGRHGETGQRPRSEIGYHAVRGGDDPGQHTIVFAMQGEKVELNVSASNRDCYASGAILAAKWLQGQPPGVYSMWDVLGIGP